MRTANTASGIINLTGQKAYKKDMDEVDTNDYHLSIHFKTSSYYQYQIVSSTEIVKLFVKYIRPWVIPPNVDTEESVIFCTSIGTPLSPGEISRKVGKIFLRYGYKLNVTRLRSLLSTHIQEAVENKRITADGIFNIFYYISQNNRI